jgi:hypothetical protein
MLAKFDQLFSVASGNVNHKIFVEIFDGTGGFQKEWVSAIDEFVETRIHTNRGAKQRRVAQKTEHNPRQVRRKKAVFKSTSHSSKIKKLDILCWKCNALFCREKTVLSRLFRHDSCLDEGLHLRRVLLRTPTPNFAQSLGLKPDAPHSKPFM